MLLTPPVFHTVHLGNITATRVQAEALSKQLTPGDVLFLTGEMGAGKTTFSQFLIREKTSPQMRVPSPTFPLVCPYDTKEGVSLWHVDLYRLEPAEVPRLGLEEHWSNGITLIEWPERLTTHPAEPLWIHFHRESEDRKLSFAGSTSWQQRLKAQIS